MKNETYYLQTKNEKCTLDPETNLVPRESNEIDVTADLCPLKKKLDENNNIIYKNQS